MIERMKPKKLPKWEDSTSYSQADRGDKRIQNSWTMHLVWDGTWPHQRRLRITVYRSRHKDLEGLWFLISPDLGFDMHRLPEGCASITSALEAGLLKAQERLCGRADAYMEAAASTQDLLHAIAVERYESDRADTVRNSLPVTKECHMSVIRYVLTHRTGDCPRTLVDPMQGRFTYASQGTAQQRLDTLRASLEKELSLRNLSVRAVECWPVHHDPKTRWFDD